MRKALLLVTLLSALHPLLAESCASLMKQGSGAVTITEASVAEAENSTPSFCKVLAVFRPTSDSLIHAEIWLPASGWNGKYMAVGSGGWGGSINHGGMAEALRRGYAASATDDGHTGESARFLMEHPEKFVDFAYRAEHEMTVEAKRLIEVFYGRGPQYSYWNGCSGGGREGLLQAYRYPDEFDGIIAGDPANVRRNAWALWLANQTFKDPADFIPPSKYSMIHQYVLDACDAKDGVKDGLIENPEACHVDFKALACKAGDGPDCLTARQVKTAQTITNPATDDHGKVYFPRLEPGTELRWGRVAGGPAPADLFLDQFRYVVYQDPNWDWKSFDLARDASKANALDADVDDLKPDLSAFAKHGGKLLLYHGWADQQVAPGASVEFYQAAVQADKQPASDWIRLYMVPGMGHCGGGEGPDTFDKVGALEQWVEKGRAPQQIIASRVTGGRAVRTRPLCPYPEVAHYKGQGSIDDAASFACVAALDLQ